VETCVGWVYYRSRAREALMPVLFARYSKFELRGCFGCCAVMLEIGIHTVIQSVDMKKLVLEIQEGYCGKLLILCSNVCLTTNC
jgi:hypothetical protein